MDRGRRARSYTRSSLIIVTSALPVGIQGRSVARHRGTVDLVTARALFLDFGGTLARVANGRTLVDRDGNPVLMPNVSRTLHQIRPAFDACFIVSNQPRVGRGEITAAEVVRRFAWVNEQLSRPFTDWRLCPHGDEDGCACRKPSPGMFLELAAAHAVDLAGSAHVGDADKDREAARRAGIPVFQFASEFFGWSR